MLTFLHEPSVSTTPSQRRDLLFVSFPVTELQVASVAFPTLPTAIVVNPNDVLLPYNLFVSTHAPVASSVIKSGHLFITGGHIDGFVAVAADPSEHGPLAVVDT